MSVNISAAVRMRLSLRRDRPIDSIAICANCNNSIERNRLLHAGGNRSLLVDTATGLSCTSLQQITRAQCRKRLESRIIGRHFQRVLDGAFLAAAAAAAAAAGSRQQGRPECCLLFLYAHAVFLFFNGPSQKWHPPRFGFQRLVMVFPRRASAGRPLAA